MVVLHNLAKCSSCIEVIELNLKNNFLELKIVVVINQIIFYFTRSIITFKVNLQFLTIYDLLIQTANWTYRS